MLHLPTLGVIRTLGGRNQKAEHQRCDRSDEAGTEPDDVLCIIGEMIPRQRPAKKGSGEGSAQDNGEAISDIAMGVNGFIPNRKSLPNHAALGRR